MKMIKRCLLSGMMMWLIAMPLMAENKALDWPALTTENKPGTRWWWLGSAVDEENITWNLESLQKAGIATVEITPIYGVKANESNEIPYLSDRWMSMLAYVQKEAQRLGMQVDMNGGTGWPFGGPNISPEYAATKQIVQTYDLDASVSEVDLQVKDAKQKDVAYLQALLFVADNGVREQWPIDQVQQDRLTLTSPKKGKLYALYVGKTRQKVKRSAPGGEGYVMNHLSKDALLHYLKRFDEAFANNKVAWPTTFFNDSYEVYGADWSPQFLEEFKNRRGYDFLDYLPEWSGQGDAQTIAKLVCDYRQTIADMLLDNFTIPWTQWAHSHGAKTRNQAHGSPGNLLDLYAAMDIPECESFGCTQFDIPRLRVDENMRRNDAVSATLRYASSAAHVAGKPYTSSESMTWLTEHFRTSLALIKPEMDLLFVNGVNRV
ncbi:MAG: glycosyl hydrolase family 2, partial [Bacteroidales bacterium]|nr:glycosyl hydrolase family 2 [Bacteroidales bacterium]